MFFVFVTIVFLINKIQSVVLLYVFYLIFLSIQIVELKDDPRGEDRRIRATLKKKVKKKQENGPLFKQQIKDVEELNQQYKDIIKQVLIIID